MLVALAVVLWGCFVFRFNIKARTGRTVQY